VQDYLFILLPRYLKSEIRLVAGSSIEDHLWDSVTAAAASLRSSYSEAILNLEFLAVQLQQVADGVVSVMRG